MSPEAHTPRARARRLPGVAVLVVFALAVLVTACSPHPSALSLTQPNGDRIPIPAACEVQTTVQGPYAATFRLHNGGSSTVFLHTGCLPPYEVTSCASGYSDKLQSLDVCPCTCGLGCPMCGACYPDGGEALEPGATKEWQWVATVFVDGTDQTSGAACKKPTAIPPGRYRVSVPLFAAAEEALAQTPVLRHAAADFTLPPASDQVLIETD